MRYAYGCRIVLKRILITNRLKGLWVTVIWLRIGTSSLRVGRGRNRGTISGRGKRYSSSVALLCPLWGPVSFLFSVKRPGRVADRSASSAEVKNAWSYVSTDPYALLELCLIKDRLFYRRKQCHALVNAVVSLRVPSLVIFLFCRSNILLPDSTVSCGAVCRVRVCKLVSTLMTYIFCES
jgi:hypothetical protein